MKLLKHKSSSAEARNERSKVKRKGWKLVICLLNFIWLIACNGDEPTQNPSDLSLPDSVTFSEHIAPIIFENCTECHRPGNAGPFTLMTYNDVAKRGKTIVHVTETRYMPPWPADTDYRHFLGERILEEREILMIQKWVKQGKALGDSTKIPALPDFPNGSNLGEPDFVLEFETPNIIKGNNKDQFLYMKVPYEIPRDTFIRLIEFIPGNSEVVHHMNSHLISYDPGRKANVYDGERVIDRETTTVQDAYERLGLPNDDGTYPERASLVCNYLPGVTPSIYPDGVGGYYMKKQGTILLDDLHYGPYAKDTFDQSRFNFFFAPGAPKRPTMEIQMGTLGISDIVPPLVIPPDTIMTFTTKAVIQNDISLLTLNPHMHLLGKSFLAYALTNEQDTIPLIHIPEWDFRWQYYYTFPKMLRIPKGSLIVVEGTFDNTADNPFNPFDPPQVVAERNGSMRTTDEMLQFIITYIPYEAGDENISLDGKRL